MILVSSELERFRLRNISNVLKIEKDELRLYFYYLFYQILDEMLRW